MMIVDGLTADSETVSPLTLETKVSPTGTCSGADTGSASCAQEQNTASNAAQEIILLERITKIEH